MMTLLTNILLYIHHNPGIEGVSLLMVISAIVAFLLVWAVTHISIMRIRHNARRVKELALIMQQTLNVSRNNVLRLSIHEKYAYNMHGSFLPEKGLSYQESLQYIHPDDRQIYIDFLRRLIKNGNTEECMFRWDLNKGEGQPNWRYIQDIGIVEFADKKKRIPTNIFCTLTDKTDQVVLERQENQMTDKYRMIFEQPIAGLAFYDKEGHLITANRKMREILRFQSENDPFYFNRTIYDMPTFREVLNNRHVEELYFCTKSVIIERGVNCYTELRLHPIYDEKKELVYITFSIRDITQERELYLQNKKNDKEIRDTNEKIQQYEAELQYLMDNCDMRFWRCSFANSEVTFYRGLSRPERKITLEHFQSCLITTSDTSKLLFEHPETAFNKPRNFLCNTRPLFHESDEPQWNLIDSVPYYDGNGHFVGCYGIIRNVTVLIKKQEQLKQETERANDSGRRKSVFMANMTHEIRTPLNAIVGFSDVLPMLTTPEEKKEITRVIMNNCDILLRLINDILAVSSLETNGIHVQPTTTDFAKDFNDICNSLAQRVQEPKVQYIIDNPYESFITKIDKGRIQQVITNFVTNAIKYTHEGHIKVGYEYQEKDGGGLYIYCEDTGVGIPKEYQEKVFDRFVKLNDFIQGTGLGLSICKAIAEGCHGDIGILSEGEGQGSTFWLWIPCQREEIIKESDQASDNT